MKLTITFVALNLIMFGLQAVGIVNVNLALTPATILESPHTILTAMFMHSGIKHLLFNMLGLLVFGSIVEEQLSRHKWIMLYLFSGFIGSLGYILLVESPFIPALGASGAIFGLMGAAAFLKPGLVIFTPYGPLPMIAAAFVWGAIEVFSFFRADNIARSAHLAGLIGGFIFAYSFKKEAKEYLYVVGIIAVIVAILAVASYMPTEVRRFNPEPENCEIVETLNERNFKYNLFECEDGQILGLTKPGPRHPSPAYYDQYFPHMLIQIMQKNCEVNYELDISQGVVTSRGTVCDENFIAMAKKCENEMVELIQIFKAEPYIDYISCDDLI